MVKAIVGANWGDEGKGKITDMLASDSDMVVRFQGGANAGHTIINEYGKFALHQLPSGIFSANTVNIIGHGVALDIHKFIDELNTVLERNVPAPRLYVSERTQVIMPYHPLFDTLEERRLSDRSFGSTKSGIAPFYSDKYAKIGFQVAELFDDDLLRSRLANVLTIKNVLLEHLYHVEPLKLDDVYAEMIVQRGLIRPYVADVSNLIREAVRANKKILLEGQLGSLKDPDHGIYPFTTSSSTLAGFGTIGAGVPANSIQEVICVTKAYSSAVGAGAFVSEIFGEEANELRNRGGDAGEYGATTGRPRRMGWFDCVAARYGCAVQGATEAALTALDVLGYLDTIKLCVGYEIDGVVTRDFPVTPRLNRAKPVWREMKGWKCDIRGIRRYADLPAEAKAYVEFIESEIGVPIRKISNGPRREEIILR
ncbi:MAG: adenylosuccinate synthase [Eubacteriales bacterium]|nr:adenylosuccinate synthase [Eubacteriales bacterium]